MAVSASPPAFPSTSAVTRAVCNTGLHVMWKLYGNSLQGEIIVFNKTTPYSRLSFQPLLSREPQGQDSAVAVWGGGSIPSLEAPEASAGETVALTLLPGTCTRV